MIALAERSLAQTEAQIANTLHCVSDRSALVGATAAEHIRAMLHGACVAAKDATGASTIHTTRLLTNVRRAVDLTWSEDTRGLRTQERDICTSTLQAMQTLGDAVEVGRGQWIATPLRLITIDGASDCMIASSAPLGALNHFFNHPIACAGASRFVSIKSLTKVEHRDVVQSMDDWLGPSSPLSAWTDQVLASHELCMEQAQGLSAEQLELYAPDILRGQQRTGRWIPAGHVGRAIDDVRLCRPRGAYARHYTASLAMRASWWWTCDPRNPSALQRMVRLGPVRARPCSVFEIRQACTHCRTAASGSAFKNVSISERRTRMRPSSCFAGSRPEWTS